MMNSFKPYWPQTIIFWGAGATQSLGISSTGAIGDKLSILSGIKFDKNLEERINKIFPNSSKEMKEELKSLLIVLGEEGDKNKAQLTLEFSDVRIKELKKIYNWFIVKEIIKRCPGVYSGDFKLADLYNLIDLHIQLGQGFNSENTYVRPEEFIIARNTINMLITIFHSEEYKLALENNSKNLKLYYDFALELGKTMQNEGLERLKDNKNLYEREFYLFSYAVISMNWDPLFLWALFNAHKKLNNSNNIPHIGNPAHPMKLFHDLAHFMAVRDIDGNSPKHWFPMNETAVQRLNDIGHSTGRRVRVGKFYFPHGSHGFRECPNCGKLTFYLGDEWGIDSKSLFPPQILPSLAYNKARSKEEENAYKNDNKYDAIQCTHCGHITESHHTPLEMQTNFKGGHPPFTEEIQRDMKVAIEKSKHIIFMGYSLPEDDLIYRSVISARRKLGNDAPKCSIVNHDKNAPDRWLYNEEATSSDDKKMKIINDISAIFGKDNIRFYGKGIPQVFLEEGKVSRKKVEEFLNWG